MGLAEVMCRTTSRILETEDECFYNREFFSYHWPLYGFGLGAAALRRSYGENARRIIEE